MPQALNPSLNLVCVKERNRKKKKAPFMKALKALFIGDLLPPDLGIAQENEKIRYLNIYGNIRSDSVNYVFVTVIKNHYREFFRILDDILNSFTNGVISEQNKQKSAAEMELEDTQRRLSWEKLLDSLSKESRPFFNIGAAQ